MMQSTKLEYEAALRAGLWQRDMAPEALNICQRQIAADRNRRFWYVAATLATLVALVFATCSCASSAPPKVEKPTVEEHTSTPRTEEQQDVSAVRIQSACVTGDAFAGRAALEIGGGIGSGVVLSTGVVITAAHVVECDGARLVHVVTREGTKYAAEVAYVDATRDYARLKVRGLAAVSSVVLAPTHVGDSVCVVAAHPFRQRQCGTIQRIEWKKLPNGIVDLWSTARIVPGNSGSGIYNDKGELVGLATNKIPCVTDPWRDDCGGLGTSLAGRIQ